MRITNYEKKVYTKKKNKIKVNKLVVFTDESVK